MSLEKAVELDPSNAPFKSILALRYQQMDGAEEQRSRSLREQVAELAPDSFTAEFTRFNAAMARGDIRSAYDHARAGVRLDPDNLQALGMLQGLLRNVGHHDLARTWLQKATLPSPHSDVVYTSRILGIRAIPSVAKLVNPAPRSNEEDDLLTEWVQHSPNSPGATLFAASNYGRKAAIARQEGDAAGAAALWQKAEASYAIALKAALRPDGGYRYANRPWVVQQYAGHLMAMGYTDKGQALFHQLLEDTGPEGSSLLGQALFHRAVAYAHLGDVDQSLVALERAFNDGFIRAWMIESFPAFDLVRDNPQFIELMARFQARNLDVYHYISEQVAAEQ
jgi:tetratricopeptide (TPR) repeat protein